ncbi:unnamed protein product [Medioppia subpectinata]|uniref:Protein kinase domain-containing protein n=1 Tax=Medioppia subpectinata TaxID=1979941 RepID=A0A7R9PU69_9ACAR|nr:unnamed protein product [Medioppia subpectinata]CAG2101455.1 unnamed protein product [Medioppia subpectinata]
MITWNRVYKLKSKGKGAFGEVYKVKHIIDHDVYAVKIIKFEDTYTNQKRQQILSEVEKLKKLCSHYVVVYRNSWLDDNHLFIEMDYYSQNLQKIIDIKPKVFGRKPEEVLNVFEYYISCEIFKEILECVQYLHESEPQVIHRDLKPSNILISKNADKNTNRFIRLGDFGSATYHDMTIASMSHTSNVGTAQYMAREIFQPRYNIKVDIYSDFGSATYHDMTMTSMSHTKNVGTAQYMAREMCKSKDGKRPFSGEVINDYNQWSIHKSLLTSDKQRLTETLDRYKNIENKFFNEMSGIQTSNFNQSLYKIASIGGNSLAIDPKYKSIDNKVDINCMKLFHVLDDDIGCGAFHSLVVTSDYCVYGWGSNREEQLGCGEQHSTDVIITPMKIQFIDNGIEYKIRGVYCYANSSFAVTTDGRVFSWGRNNCHLGHNISDNVFKPQMIDNLFNIETYDVLYIKNAIINYLSSPSIMIRESEIRISPKPDELD